MNEVYEFTVEHSDLINNPRFLIGSSRSIIKDLTYRKVNDWSSKGLISCSRKNKKSGWRKFSVVDAVKLCIISDLRRYGFSTVKIKALMAKMAGNEFMNFDLKSNGKNPPPFLQLEYSIFACMSKGRLLLLADENGNILLADEKDIVQRYLLLDGLAAPAVILPFFSYVKRITAQIK